MITITFFDDFKNEVVTVPLNRAPDELINPAATRADIDLMHRERAKMRRAQNAAWDAEEQAEVEEMRHYW